MQMNRYDISRDQDKKLVGRYRRDEETAQPGTGDHPAEVPMHGSYGNLLFDARWKSKRNEIMARDKERCVICQSPDELQVHHRQYQYVKSEKAFKVPWDYDNHLLITVCKSCHQRGHSKFKVPIIII